MRLFYRTRYSTMRASLLTRQKGFPVFPPPNPFANRYIRMGILCSWIVYPLRGQVKSSAIKKRSAVSILIRTDIDDPYRIPPLPAGRVNVFVLRC